MVLSGAGDLIAWARCFPTAPLVEEGRLVQISSTVIPQNQLSSLLAPRWPRPGPLTDGGVVDSVDPIIQHLNIAIRDLKPGNGNRHDFINKNLKIAYGNGLVDARHPPLSKIPKDLLGLQRLTQDLLKDVISELSGRFDREVMLKVGRAVM
ncbi:hypothetical protein BCR34DRAFT_590896 [Clohesyomyces aquaticus]|uniref:Uncharacterized protein n=1 Tax=Clohesyomyces aquaticus TaxID=1231657 RepID=A0A1Y1Z5F1_9PLEO|nr:hypothetical protein BCR34DRAFT_590896 [Clohesyomyces aquaticus]